MDGRPNSRKKAAFLNPSSLGCTLPEYCKVGDLSHFARVHT